MIKRKDNKPRGDGPELTPHRPDEDVEGGAGPDGMNYKHAYNMM